jgi:hypothetical protein
MPEYRLYSIDKRGHVAGPPKVVDCPDDASLLAEATGLLDGHDIEIWQGIRLVAYLAADEKRA